MVLEIPNQPIVFIRDGESVNEKNARLMWDRRVYCQLVKTTQTQQFQFQVTPESGINLIANGGFNGNLNGWFMRPLLIGFSYDNGKAKSGPVFQGELYQNVVIQNNKTYRLSYDIEFFGDATLTTQVSLLTLFGTMGFIGGQSNIDSYNHGSGHYILYCRQSSGATTQELNFVVINPNWATAGVGQNYYVTIDNVELVELTEPILVLEDCNNNYIRDITSVQRFEDRVTYTHSWENETDGQCYKFCLYGTDNLSLNYLQGAFCLRDNSGACLVDEFNVALNEYIK